MCPSLSLTRMNTSIEKAANLLRNAADKNGSKTAFGFVFSRRERGPKRTIWLLRNSSASEILSVSWKRFERTHKETIFSPFWIARMDGNL